MEDVTKVFTAEAKSVERVMNEQNRGFYVPSYQRPYAWDRDNVGGLLTNICEGLQMLEEMPDAITFLGTFIFIHDTQYATVEPQVRPELPASVYLVIDGQQRLTTLATIAAQLHWSIRELHQPKKLKLADETAVGWITQQAEELLQRLEGMFCFDKRYGQFRWYPRIIRAFDDRWGYSEKTALYRSPTASLLAAYIAWWQGLLGADGPFTWSERSLSPSHERLQQNFALIGKTIDKVAAGDDSLDLPRLSELALSDDRQRRFFWHEAPQSIREQWLVTEDPSIQIRRLQRLSRLLLFSRYLLDRVMVTQVLVTKEEYAFDLFEMLNTTGEPLTAYETFKPAVIRAEGLEKYQASPSAASLSVVERYLEQNAKRRQQASDRLLVPFALFEDGYKLGKHLREQRNWLRRKYDDAADSRLADASSRRRNFLQGMAAVAGFLTEWWPEGTAAVSPDEFGMGEHESEILLGVNALRAADHHIVVALLARFHHAAATSTGDDRRVAIAEYADAIRAVTAFFVLWRATRQTTENIDLVYRQMMARGLAGCQPLKRSSGATPRAEDVKKVFRTHLEEKGVGELAGFVQKASVLPLYRVSVPLTRLILLAAGHDAVPNPEAPGLTYDGRADTCAMLTMEMWSRDFEVEHVAPKEQRAAEWPASLYASSVHGSDLVDSIGNLTLLPANVNASVSNRNWREKHASYAILSCQEEERAAALVEEWASQGIKVPSLELWKQAHYMPHLRALALMPETSPWDEAFVLTRGRNVAERAWRRFAPWLGMTGIHST